MSNMEIILPAMGEGIIEATITRWLVQPGQEVEIDQSIVEIATDKVDSEIPSPVKGRIKEFLFQEGEVPQVGQVIAIIEVEGESAQPSTPQVEKQAVTSQEPKKPEVKEEPKPAVSQTEETEPEQYNQYLSPLVKSMIKKEGITAAEVDRIVGTGLNSRITRDDIVAYIEKRKAIAERPKAAPVSVPEIASADVEIVEMDRMRKLIADHMVLSKQTSAHVTSFIEADVTNLVAWRNKEKDAFFQREGQKLTLTHLIIEATAKAIKQYPGINVSVDGDKIILKKNVNIGIATALPDGNLIVPVIPNAHMLNLSGIVAKANDLTGRARINKLQPSEIQGGTFTITNLGMFETLTGTPIINQPQVAILAVGAFKKRVVVIETEAGDTIGIRQIAMLSLSYDHRVVDGALGGMFLKAVKDNLENF